MDVSANRSPCGFVEPTVTSLRLRAIDGLGRKRLCAISPSAWVTRAAAAPTSALRPRSQATRQAASARSAPTGAAGSASAAGGVAARAGEGVVMARRAPAAISDAAKVKGPNPVIRQFMDSPRGPRIWEQEPCRRPRAAKLLTPKGGLHRGARADREPKGVLKGSFSAGADAQADRSAERTPSPDRRTSPARARFLLLAPAARVGRSLKDRR